MELTQLKYFYEAARCGHITNAAGKLHIAQPALTQSIRRLENELGVKLFERRGRSVELSACGKYLYNQLSGVLKTLDSVPEELKKISEQEERTIKVNILAASLFATELIIEYKKNNPGVKFHLHQSADEEYCDCTITSVMTGIAPHIKGSGMYRTFTEEICLAVPADSDYAKNGSVSLTDTREDGFISLSGSKPFHSICDTLCRTVGFTPNIIFESDSPSTVRGLIGSGLGIGFWPAFTWGSINSDSVKLIPISSPKCSREITVICNDPESEAAVSFYNFLCDSFGRVSKQESASEK